MFDKLGVEIKKGDLLIYLTGYSGGIQFNYIVAVDFTEKNLVYGKQKQRLIGWGERQRYKNSRPMCMPSSCIVVNHMWSEILEIDEKIKKTLEECNVKPNINDIRLPTRRHAVEHNIENIACEDNENLEDI